MNKIKTIIVDDEPKIRRRIEKIVQNSGEDWEILGAFGNGIEVIEFLKENQIWLDLLITDVKMPEMDGLSLMNEIKNLNTGNEFTSIIISGYDDFQFLQKAVQEGAFDYLLKPINRTQFIELLQRSKESIEEKRYKNLKWKDLVKKTDKLTVSLQTQLLTEAVSSELEDIAKMYWIKDFPDGMYQMLYVSVDEFPAKTRDYSDNDWGLMTYAVENIIDEVIKKFTPSLSQKLGWWWRDSGFHFWVVLYDPNKENGEEFFRTGDKFSRELKSCIHKYTSFSFSIAHSNPFEDLCILPELNKQLHSLIRMRMFKGGNNIFSPNFTKELEINHKPLVSADMKAFSSKLNAMLGQSETLVIKNEMQKLFKKITKLRSPVEVQHAIQYLIIYMYKVWMEDTEMFLNDLESTFQTIKSESNLYRLESIVTQIVIQVHNKKRAYQEDPIHAPVMKVKMWINENLGHKITIKDLADLVYMNPTYFCEYFKKETGKTILDYITDVRLERAKYLLQNPELKIIEISQLLGYQDTKYFSRLFKRKWGCLPSEFKKNNSK
ncbi:response regulator [Peribacillus sp. NJ11]|uniref:response regulator transcription factor n=1 Tax=Peribacillus sp. NJ11 TaxID=3055861 RepID=UPI0025A1F666|nr:response regulator [Peribacillus sp. NJ11]MDM5224584.1 response regulator [Peribacillus sp. NJ11]